MVCVESTHFLPRYQRDSPARRCSSGDAAASVWAGNVASWGHNRRGRSAYRCDTAAPGGCGLRKGGRMWKLVEVTVTAVGCVTLELTSQYLRADVAGRYLLVRVFLQVVAAVQIGTQRLRGGIGGTITPVWE